MTWRRTTTFLLIGAAATLAAYDLTAYSVAGQDATITQVIRDATAGWPMIPYLAGVLTGHIFWGGHQGDNK